MLQTREVCETVFKNGVAVLMARIVDATGRRVRRAQIESLAYAIFEVDAESGACVQAVRGHDGAFLDVDSVFLDSLACEDAWSIDVSGYNFRHEIRANAGGSFPRSHARYEIRYLFVPKLGEPIVIRFFVRIKSDDRRRANSIDSQPNTRPAR
jgi:hypothetical protein